MNTVLLVLFACALLGIVVLVLRNQAFEAAAERRARGTATALMEEWRRSELAATRVELVEIARDQALVELDAWKAEFERSVRADAVRRSESVTRGKVTEHFVPYLPDFEFNPRDARFLGSPVDFVVFDGLTEGDVRGVVFVEVKTGRASLTGRERQGRDAIESGRISWIELRPEAAIFPISNDVTGNTLA